MQFNEYKNAEHWQNDRKAREFQITLDKYETAATVLLIFALGTCAMILAILLENA